MPHAEQHLGGFAQCVIQRVGLSQLLIERSESLNDYERDYDYMAKLNDAWGEGEAEEEPIRRKEVVTMTDQGELITVQAAADRLAVSRWMIYRLIWEQQVKKESQ